MKFWTDISNIGSTRLADPKDLRELTLLNRIAAISTINLLGFIPITLFFGVYPAAGYVSIGVLLCLAALLFNHLGHFKFVRLYYMFVAVGFITFLLVALSGKNGGSQIVFILLVTLQLVLFREPTGVLWVFLLLLALFGVSSYWVENNTSMMDGLGEFIQRFSFYTNIVSCMILVFAVVYYFRNTTYAYEKLIVEQNDKISQKNKEITDSINYAKRIQDAKLPKPEDLANHLPQSFILFKPKDIVSGDFYFFRKHNDVILVAAADCTGHGVPGAFMSLIGMEKLAEAATQATAPSEILAHLNNGIKTSLNQTGGDESTRDGMDIALCSVDIKKNIVMYSGANRPLWIIRKNGTGVEEVKATKTAIGGLTKADQVFERNEITLSEGDTFYIFSDGYADQFSGTTGKKLMTKKLKDILLSIQSKTMAEQQKHLDHFLEEWKAGSEQLDDVLVLGVKI